MDFEIWFTAQENNESLRMLYRGHGQHCKDNGKEPKGYEEWCRIYYDTCIDV